MKFDTRDLLFVLDIQKWQALQDALAIVTGMSIVTVDYKGSPITQHSSCSEFCKHVRALPDLSMECQKCDSRGGLEATRLREPYIYLCHANILDAAVPIIVNNNYLGAIMIGQALVAKESDAAKLEVLCTPSRQKLEQQLGSDMYLMDLLPKLSLDRVKTIVDMLFHLCSYIVEEAIEKNLALDICADVLNPNRSQSDLSDFRMRNLENIKRKLNNAIIDVHITQDTARGEK